MGMALTPPDALPERTFPCMRALFAREHMVYSYKVSAAISSPTQQSCPLRGALKSSKEANTLLGLWSRHTKATTEW